MMSVDIGSLKPSLRITLYFCLVAPVLAAMTIAVVRHVSRPEFEFVTASAAQEKALFEHVVIVQEARKLLDKGQQADPGEAESIIVRWHGLFANGKAHALPTVAYDDVITEGLKSQVWGTADEITTLVVSGAQRRIREGSLEPAIRDCLDSIRLLADFAQGDLPAVSTINLRIRRILYMLRDALDKSTPGRAIQVCEELAPMLAKNDLGKRIDASIRSYNRLTERDALRPLTQKEVDFLHGLDLIAKSEPDPAAKFREVRTTLRNANYAAPRIISDLTLTYISEYENRAFAEKLLKAARQRVRPTTPTDGTGSTVP